MESHITHITCSLQFHTPSEHCIARLWLHVKCLAVCISQRAHPWRSPGWRSGWSTRTTQKWKKLSGETLITIDLQPSPSQHKSTPKLGSHFPSENPSSSISPTIRRRKGPVPSKGRRRSRPSPPITSAASPSKRKTTPAATSRCSFSGPFSLVPVQSWEK